MISNPRISFVLGAGCHDCDPIAIKSFKGLFEILRRIMLRLRDGTKTRISDNWFVKCSASLFRVEKKFFLGFSLQLCLAKGSADYAVELEYPNFVSISMENLRAMIISLGVGCYGSTPITYEKLINGITEEFRSAIAKGNIS